MYSVVGKYASWPRRSKRGGIVRRENSGGEVLHMCIIPNPQSPIHNPNFYFLVTV